MAGGRVDARGPGGVPLRAAGHRGISPGLSDDLVGWPPLHRDGRTGRMPDPGGHERGGAHFSLSLERAVLDGTANIRSVAFLAGAPPAAGPADLFSIRSRAAQRRLVAPVGPRRRASW